MTKHCLLMIAIEENRKEMFKLAETHGLSSKETVECSQKLDILLNYLNKQLDPNDK